LAFSQKTTSVELLPVTKSRQRTDETQLLNFGLLSHISLISALRGLETSPNIFK